MPRPRQYATEAARQAAHRTRTQANADQLHSCLYRLEEAMWDASERGDPLALACRASSLETMLARLTDAFKSLPNTSVEPPKDPLERS
jgi:hypothetical protein